MLVVAALGGNAVLQRGDPPDAAVQERNVRRAVASLAPVAAAHDLVITHGNGPQVGLLALESEQDASLHHPYPLDVIGAETAGMIGYWLARELRTVLPQRESAVLLTQTLVDPADPAFTHPTKFVGQVYNQDEATLTAAARGWTVGRDGDYWRRVVPSPSPQSFVELPVIRMLVTNGVLVICAGGGGIPVVATDDGYRGVEAVVDKDLAATRLAVQLQAHALLFLTDVTAVFADFGTPRARPIRRISAGELRGMSFPDGSMGPKVAAACEFVDATGGTAVIGDLTHAPMLLSGEVGTTVHA